MAYWFRYHVAKAAIAALLLIVLVTLGVLLWKVFLKAGSLRAQRRAALSSACVLVTLLALFSSTVVMANVQGVVAPFSSLLPVLGGSATDAGLADTLDQVSQQLAASRGAGDRIPPALDVMIDDFARYHVAMAVIAALMTTVLVGMSVASWKRRARTEPSDRRERRVWGAFGVVSALLSLVLAVVAAANTATATDPAPALLAFFEGGW